MSVSFLALQVPQPLCKSAFLPQRPWFRIPTSCAFRMSNFGASARYEMGQVSRRVHLKAPSCPLQRHLQPQLTSSPGFSFGQLRGAPGNGPGFASGVGRTAAQTPITLSPEKTVNQKCAPVYKTNGSSRTRSTDARSVVARADLELRLPSDFAVGKSLLMEKPGLS